MKLNLECNLWTLFLILLQLRSDTDSVAYNMYTGAMFYMAADVIKFL